MSDTKQMTLVEFNEKYEDYLTDRFYGLAIDHPDVINYLDAIFQDLIKIPDFEYQQIKGKFSYVCFYSNLSHELNSAIEKKIQEILDKDKE